MNLTIALVDWNWMGHHPMYFRQFLSGFHAIGCNVVPVCPKIAIDDVNLLCSDLSDGGSTIHAPLAARPPRMRQSILPQFMRGPEQAITCYGRLGRQLRAWEKKSGIRIDLVFFPTIYDTQFRNFNLAERFFGFPWSGIYLLARAFRQPGTTLPYSNEMPCPEQIFSCPGMNSVCLLDEGVTDEMQKLAPGKPVFAFPDITDVSVADHENSLADKLLCFANGRKIVVSLGHLQKTKGILELCEAACDPSLKDVVFFFAGEIYWKGFTDQEQHTILSAWEQAPNILTHLQRITTDAAMNEIIRAADLVFAAYTDFPSSSNIMTKAARFRKPLLVSDGFLMAERVRKHRLGGIVPEGSVPDIIARIRHFCENGADADADFAGYYDMHSSSAFHTALNKVVDAATRMA